MEQAKRNIDHMTAKCFIPMALLLILEADHHQRHPYKQCVTLVFRTFFPIFALLDSTGMPSLGSPLRPTRKLVYMEKLVAALLLCGEDVKDDIEAALATAPPGPV